MIQYLADTRDAKDADQNHTSQENDDINHAHHLQLQTQKISWALAFLTAPAGGAAG